MVAVGELQWKKLWTVDDVHGGHMRKQTRNVLSGLVAASVVMASCARVAPAAVGDCVRDATASVVFGRFPEKVDCPTEGRSFQERLADPIYRVVAVGKTVDEVDANPACENGISFAIWYDDDWAVCGSMLR